MGYRVSVDSLMPQPRNERRKVIGVFTAFPQFPQGVKTDNRQSFCGTLLTSMGSLGRRSASGRFSHPVTRAKVMASARLDNSCFIFVIGASLTRMTPMHVGIEIFTTLIQHTVDFTCDRSVCPSRFKSSIAATTFYCDRSTCIRCTVALILVNS